MKGLDPRPVESPARLHEGIVRRPESLTGLYLIPLPLLVWEFKMFTLRPTLRPLVALLVAGGLFAQEAPAQPASINPYAVQYKHFMRGEDGPVRDEAEGRLEWWRNRMGGDLGADFYHRLIKEAEKERAHSPGLFPRQGQERPMAVSAPSWVNLGPTRADFTQNGTTLHKVDSGRLRTILPHPSNENTVYILASGGGLWRTTDFTSASPTWTPLTDFIGSTVGGAAAFGKVPTTIFLGAGDAFDLGVGGFVVKSSDGGDTWSSATFLGTTTKVLDLKVDTSTSSDVVLVGTENGLYRSADGNPPFTLTASGSGQAFQNKWVWSLVRTSAGWIAATQDRDAGGSKNAGSLYLSTDHGITWTPIPNAGSVMSGIGRVTLGVGAPGDSVVYAFAATTKNLAQKDLLRSTDGGLNWTALSIGTKTPTNALGDQNDMDIMANQAFYNQMLLVDPSDANRNSVVIGGQLASARSVDGGASWRILSDWLAQGLPYVHADLHTAAVSTAGGTKRYFLGTDGGIFVSTDGGDTWDDTKNTGVVSHLIFALAVNPNLPGSAMVGLQDNGTRIRVLSPSPSGTFNQFRGGDGFGVGWAPGSGYSLSSYVYNEIKKSTVNPPASQGNLTSFTSGLGATGDADNGNSYYFYTPIITPTGAADPSGVSFFTYGSSAIGPNSKKIFKSSSTGWTAIGVAGTHGLSDGRFVRPVMHGLGVHPTDLNRVAAAGNGGNILITTDGGANWTEVFLGSTGIDGQNIGWVGYNANVAWANSSTLYACSEATVSGVARIAKSINAGNSWTRADSGLPDVPVTKVVVDPSDPTGDTALCATWLGVYRTSNGGGSWARYGTGLPQVMVSDIYIAPDGSYIRISTYGRGVWELQPSLAPSGPSITTHPASQSKVSGETATFSVVPSGTAPFTYQWSRNGIAISTSGTSSSYTTPVLALSDSGSTYGVRVTNSLGFADSNLATLTVTAAPQPPGISTQPQNFNEGLVGGTASFSVTASGTGPFTYTWTKNGGSVGTNASTLTLSNLVLSDNNAQIVATVSNAGGHILSTPATLKVRTRDLSGDNTTDNLDLAYISKAYGTSDPFADLNGDGIVNDLDIDILLAGL